MTVALRLLFLCLAWWAAWPVWAAPQVWVALAEEGGAYAEAAAVLRSELEGTQQKVAGWQQVLNDKAEPPEAIITVGVAAFSGTLDWLAARGAAWDRVPVLATLLPRAAFDEQVAQSSAGRRTISAAVLDQPIGRQLALLKRALPDRRRIGVLSGPQTQALLKTVQKEAAARGQTVVTGPAIATTDDIYPSLKVVLDEAEVILAMPDPVVYHGTSIQNILLTAYRARVPLVAFSPAYTKAGAVLALYSTPAQVARRAAEMLRNWFSGRGLPPPQAPREFAVVANVRVAASLGLQLDEAAVLAEDLRRLEGP
jgi:hypothetical protein